MLSYVLVCLRKSALRLSFIFHCDMSGMFAVSGGLLQWSQCSVAAACWHGLWYIWCPAMSTVWPAWCRRLPATEPTDVLSRCPSRAFCTESRARLFFYFHTRYIVL